MASSACHDASAAQPGEYGNLLRDVDELNATLGAMIAEARLSSSKTTIESMLSQNLYTYTYITDINVYALAALKGLGYANEKLLPCGSYSIQYTCVQSTYLLFHIGKVDASRRAQSFLRRTGATNTRKSSGFSR